MPFPTVHPALRRVVPLVMAILLSACTGGDSPSAATSPPSSVTPTGGATSSEAAVRPFAGLLAIADRGNNRLLVVDPAGKVVWRYPSPSLPPPPDRFYFPDDVFWVHRGRALLVNEEENDVLIEIAYPSGRVLWTYGHAGIAGSAPGYLHQPDDVYPAPGGGVVVADALNCRILFFGPHGKPTRQLGATGNCTHGLPATVGYPNGDTPLPNGDLLLSELNGGYVDEVTSNGNRVWTLRVPGVPVPSDPQRLAGGSYMVVDYERPGRIVRFTRWGKVLWSYGPSSGRGMLDHPSLAVPLPNGLVAVNDDYRHRVLLIDPATDRIVWSYGVADAAGTGPNRLRFPDGLDLLLPGGVVPLHVDFASPLPAAGRP
ncbi:MAG TPA: PQQ-binding-like beta-propeller repeat protein [Actinomycetota bacterium]|nr:PQQ-binding-like beta-propeller repeat protein [Actinomycetota bacterium]